MRLALRAHRLLLGGLVLAVLPPLLQLEVNEFPHHPSLGQADGCQTGHPYGEHIEVASREGKALVLCPGQPEAKRQDREGEGEEAGDDEEERPQSKTFLLVLVTEVEEA